MEKSLRSFHPFRPPMIIFLHTCREVKKCCSSSWLTILSSKYNLNTFVESISLAFFFLIVPSGLLSSIAINCKWYHSETLSATAMNMKKKLLSVSKNENENERYSTRNSFSFTFKSSEFFISSYFLPFISFILFWSHIMTNKDSQFIIFEAKRETIFRTNIDIRLHHHDYCLTWIKALNEIWWIIINTISCKFVIVERNESEVKLQYFVNPHHRSHT